MSRSVVQDGVLKNKETYEIMDAQLVGLYQDTSLVLGKHSGRHAFRSRLQVNCEELGNIRLIVEYDNDHTDCFAISSSGDS